jgi:hypothetical protein
LVERAHLPRFVCLCQLGEDDPARAVDRARASVLMYDLDRVVAALAREDRAISKRVNRQPKRVLVLIAIREAGRHRNRLASELEPSVTPLVERGRGGKDNSCA